MIPKFALAQGHVFLHVDDVEKALKFYRDVLGIRIQRTRSEWIGLHSGRITDPFGNTIGLHDHRQ